MASIIAVEKQAGFCANRAGYRDMWSRDTAEFGEVRASVCFLTAGT